MKEDLSLFVVLGKSVQATFKVISLNAQMVFQCFAVIDFHGDLGAFQESKLQDGDWPLYAVMWERAEETFVGFIFH